MQNNSTGGVMNSGSNLLRRVALLFSVFAVAGVAVAQTGTGTLQEIKVLGPSLEGNLEGDDPNRTVFDYLPPSYATAANRRYPVVYFLHGYGATAQAYINLLGLPEAADGVFGAEVREMIVVLPDASSVWNGSMYSNSPTTGFWEDYVAEDLVGYIDSHYRTVAEPASRGLSGHSMGGYGTLRIGMKQAGVFGALFAMSSCCLMNQAPNLETVEQQMARTANGPPQPGAAGPGGRGGRGGGAFANVTLAQAAAWAPNPQNPPLYIDWPYRDGELDPLVAAKWAANSPLVFVDQYVPVLESYRAIMLDVGDQDGLMATNVQLAAALERLGVEHGFEVYDGDHGNRVAQRFRENVLPFFSENLD
jgi:S-formylglutathione hydrolase FrmB